MSTPRKGPRYTYNRHAERPVAVMWWTTVEQGLEQLVDFSDPGYTFEFKIGAPGYQALLTKTDGIVGTVGSGVEPTGSPNIIITWNVGELDLEPGIYDWTMRARITGDLDRVEGGTIEILNAIL